MAFQILDANGRLKVLQLAGPQGAQGARGLLGWPGFDGDDGEEGFIGLQGLIGPAGPISSNAFIVATGGISGTAINAGGNLTLVSGIANTILLPLFILGEASNVDGAHPHGTSTNGTLVYTGDTTNLLNFGQVASTGTYDQMIVDWNAAQKVEKVVATFDIAGKGFDIRLSNTNSGGAFASFSYTIVYAAVAAP